VYYPPDTPIIAFNADQWYADGEDLTIACKVKDLGIPRAELRMDLPDGTSIVGDQLEKNAIYYYVESTMIVRPNHDGEKVMCFADSAEPTLSKESFKTLKVAFGPSSVSILGNRAVKEDTLITLLCNPDGTNPKSTIQWIEPDYANLPEHARCPIGNICNHVAGRLETNGSRLTLRAHWKDDGGRITCQATNEETWKVAEGFVTLDVLHRPVWNGTENDRIIGASIGDKVVLNCDVFANPPAFRYEWKYLGNDQSKVYDPCYWEIRTNIYPCDDNEDCDYKKWEGGQWVPYDDPCGLEVTPPPVPVLLNSELPSLPLTIELDANGKDNFGVYLCVATNDHGSASFQIEIEDKDYAMRRTTELMIIVGIASLLGLLIIIAVIVVVIVSTIRKRRLVRYATSSASSEAEYDQNFIDDNEKIYDVRLNNGTLHPYYQQQLHHQQRQQQLHDTSGNYSVVNGNVSNVGSNGNVSYDHDSYGNVSMTNGSAIQENAGDDVAQDESGSSGIAADNSIDNSIADNSIDSVVNNDEGSISNNSIAPAHV